MRLSGIDPGIIRELSGIYKPFVKAFKELISNAYDADARTVRIVLSDDYSSMEVLDDGTGMTPYGFRDSFARLGGSTAWQRDGRSPGGRPRIGYKGIGFLAVARYCSALHVRTHCRTPYTGSEQVLIRKRQTIPLKQIVGNLVSAGLLAERIQIADTWLASAAGRTRLTAGGDYVRGHDHVRLTSERARNAKHLRFDYTVDCKGLALCAVLDFDYLLGLERKADLRVLDDFCTVAVTKTSPQAQAFTSVRLHQLKDFVVRELSAPRPRGKSWNVASWSGKEQFLWRLARSVPLSDARTEGPAAKPIRRLNELQAAAKLPALVVKWRRDEAVALSRPTYLTRRKGSAVPIDGEIIPIDFVQGGLHVVGYLLAQSQVIYPAELRGLSIRVRNVAIGDASFLGHDHLFAGPRRAAMCQITGEMLVLRGMDAADAINPGRESFYEENADYRMLQSALFGSEGTVGGLVGEAVQHVLERTHVRSQLTSLLNSARDRRKALVDVSSAVNFYSRDDGHLGRALKAFFATPVRTNGLASVRDVTLRPEHKVAGLRLEAAAAPSRDGFEIDYGNRCIRLDFGQDIWSTTVYLLGQYYEVMIKHGKPDHPICEFDTEAKRIYINWGHPVKLHMTEAAFLRSAILLRLAHDAAPKNGDAVMELALNMLAFRAE